jgi:hypothetical protein
MTTPLPAFVFWLCGASAMLLIALAVPLWLGRIPPNRLYGARFAATLDTADVWYAINARAGRNLACIGASYLVLIGALALNAAWNRFAPLLAITAVFLAALIANTIILRRAAVRLAGTRRRQRSR